MDNPIAGITAGADLSTKQFFFVKLNATRQVILVSGATDRPLGVLQNKPTASGQPATVAGPGAVTKVSAGGTITAGDSVGSDASGEAITLLEGTDTTKYILGIALESAVDGDIVYIQLTAPHRAS
jgi:hypothetical protein